MLSLLVISFNTIVSFGRGGTVTSVLFTVTFGIGRTISGPLPLSVGTVPISVKIIILL